MSETSSKRNFVKSVSNALHLSRTAERIVDSLARARRYLPVKELVKRVRMSERSVRKHLVILMRKGVLHRRATSGQSKRVKYEYSLKPAEDILKAAQHDFKLTLIKLETAVKHLVRRTTSPKNASSSRN